ncbi:Mrp/NBP35 family ATP-binding protein [uncultured Alistipes sp.]|uniref:Mrp/NBP35 family ATP-binding protein n=1 Tax=uncultured Alistipes sp. TaxID=538949 RepID=UPI002638E50A|nr:Mrp/NBP35 family ATP-binding protein [uncultured Alistipes sp.]
MTKEDILDVLHDVQHPELKSDIVTLGMVEGLSVSDGKVQFSLLFSRSRDPFALSIKKRAEEAIAVRYPQYADKTVVFIKEAAPKKPAPKEREKLGEKQGVSRIVAVSSAKGGVGKSTVTANLAVALAGMGYRVGLLDTDIYGPSQPTMFGVEGYRPEGKKIDGKDWIVPAEAFGVKIMSIGFFIDPSDALMWRGPMATNALRQMIHQTLWGPLDFLLLDLPPGTGDVHLSLIGEMKIDGAVIVSTPQRVALADVVRGVAMFRNEKIGIPVLGLVENMAWFTPAELPDHRYYIFGREGARRLAEETGLPLLAEIPLVQSVRESGDEGRPISADDSASGAFYRTLAENVVAELEKKAR